MSTEDRSAEIKKVIWHFTRTLIIIGTLFLAAIILYIRGSGKLAIEYIEKDKASKHIQNRLIESHGAIKELHAIIDSTTEASQDLQRYSDSVEKVTTQQSKQIKRLQDENKKMGDSLRLVTKRVRVYNLGPGND